MHGLAKRSIAGEKISMVMVIQKSRNDSTITAVGRAQRQDTSAKTTFQGEWAASLNVLSCFTRILQPLKQQRASLFFPAKLTPGCERVRLALLMCVESQDAVDSWDAFMIADPLSAEWMLVLNSS